eukprot:m.225374 g.225374  ORF g.225374 m.225374 type:complete len:70 (+) comp17041_c0_seq1:526-735(+)
MSRSSIHALLVERCTHEEKNDSNQSILAGNEGKQQCMQNEETVEEHRQLHINATSPRYRYDHEHVYMHT